jgi:hypothetical protein
VPAGVLGRVSPDWVQDLRPVFEAAVVAGHDFGLAEVDGLKTNVDER